MRDFLTVDSLLTLCGAICGGALGYFAFGWMLNQGFYAMVLPGGLARVRGWVGP